MKCIILMSVFRTASPASAYQADFDPRLSSQMRAFLLDGTKNTFLFITKQLETFFYEDPKELRSLCTPIERRSCGLYASMHKSGFDHSIRVNKGQWSFCKGHDCSDIVMSGTLHSLHDALHVTSFVSQFQSLVS